MRYFKKLVGTHVYLSPMNEDDAEAYTKWLNDKAVSGYLGNFHRLISLNNEKKALESMTNDGHNYAIVLLDGDVLLGNIGLMDINTTSRKATVGLFIGEAENRGKGYGADALRLMLNYGFNTLNLHNIALNVDADNQQGIACYQKVGFKQCGRRREAQFKDGHYTDDIQMDILASEFQLT